jgi:hypothetical protein
MSTTQFVLITGNTYPVKDALRAMGGRWDAGVKGWRVPAEREAEARALLPAPAPRARGIRTAAGLCLECGDDCGGTAYRCGYR